MKRNVFCVGALLFAICLFGAVLFALGIPAEAQQASKVPRIGFLSVTSPSAIPFRTEAFRQGLRELGYMEGKNIVIEYLYSDGNADRLPNLAAELVSHKVEVIVTHGEAGDPSLEASH